MNLKLIIAVTLISTVIVACKKYNEGPRISFRSKKERVSNEWVLSDRYVADTLNMWEDSLNTGVLRFTKAGFYSLSTDTLQETGEWAFNHDKKKIVLDINSDTDIRPDVLQIQKLKEEELWWSFVDTSGSTIEERYVVK